MRAVLLTLLASGLAVAAGCAGPARLSRADLVGTVWREECPHPAIATATVRLDDDGRMAWSYVSSDSVIVEDVHTWAVEDGALLLRWNMGNATSRYPAGRDPGRLRADSSTFCVDTPPTLERVR